MIQVQNITKSFDGFRALDDLSFTVPHGRMTILIGASGSCQPARTSPGQDAHGRRSTLLHGLTVWAH